MGKGSKPSTPPPSAQEIALADISIDIANDYKNRYRPLEGDLLELASRDRTGLVQGRSNVDTQRALDADNATAVARGATSGGYGSGAANAAIDAGSTGGALATANQNAFEQGKRDQTSKIGSAVGSVSGGQDVSFAGIRNAANVSNANTINKFNADQQEKLDRAKLAENVISGAVSGYMKGQTYGANQAAMTKLADNQIKSVQDQYFAQPMSLSPQAQPYSIYTPPGVSLAPYNMNSGLGFTGPIPMRPGFGVRK
jgi:hypothetical protein